MSLPRAVDPDWSERVPAPPLIPLPTFFGNPVRSRPRLSPDGKRLVYLAPVDGVMNVWVRTVGENDDRPLTFDRGRGVPVAFWADDNEHLFFMQDAGGDENFHVFAIPGRGGPARDLTPWPGARSFPIAFHASHPHEVLIATNRRDRRYSDVVRLDLRTGAEEDVVRNDFGAITFTADTRLEVRAARIPLPDGGFELRTRDGRSDPWRPLFRVSPDDEAGTAVYAVGEGDRTLYAFACDGVEFSELRGYDLASGAFRVIAAEPDAQASALHLHPVTMKPLAIAFERERDTWKALDPSVEGDLAALREARPGDFAIESSDNADDMWCVQYDSDRSPGQWFLWHRREKRAEFLFSSRPDLDALPLAEMRPVSFPARDGLRLSGYLTLPPGAAPGALPAVVYVHGGPWVRDSWGFNPVVQWLANRGYAVLQVNYRGSTGYGKSFLTAGYREWGGKMQDDVSDAALWLAGARIADPRRIALMGGSYGGYATLRGMTATPELWACGVAMCGPSNLLTFIETIPPYWKPIIQSFKHRVGDPEKDAEMFRERSPLFHVDRIRNPLYVAQGANDPRVKKEESLQMVQALRAAGREVEYIEFADEGHGFMRPENRLTHYAAVERFLSRHIGGRCESAPAR
jgi:dipeptidyl aminopeptidase/acylaminoacyl peptidase